jgi:hypothetical protein
MPGKGECFIKLGTKTVGLEAYRLYYVPVWEYHYQFNGYLSTLPVGERVETLT